MLDVSVILVSYNTIEMTKKSLRHLFFSQHKLSLTTIVIDNASSDHSADILRHDYPNITLIENKKNAGFGRANNQAIPYINSRYILLLNTDAFVATDTIEKTVQYMDENPECGILGVKLLGRDGVLQPSCRYFPTPWNIFLNRTGFKRIFKHSKLIDDMQWDHASVRNCDWVPGCYLLVRKEVIEQVGFFDPRYFLYYEELDFCLAAKKAGWYITYFPDTTVIHIGGESAKSEGKITSSGRQIESMQIESELLYFRKNYGLFTVVLNVFLNSLADGIQISKDLIKLKPLNWQFVHVSHSILILRLLYRTRLGTKPTR